VYVALTVAIAAQAVATTVPLIERGVVDHVVTGRHHALWPYMAMLVGAGVAGFVLASVASATTRSTARTATTRW
jgi:hypothetical protein